MTQAHETTIVLSLGGNLGDVPQTFANAVKKLHQHGVRDICTSSCYTTSPVDCADEAPDFVNAALSGTWGGTAEELLKVCKLLESEAGRPDQYARNADRPLDIDIILFGDTILKTVFLTIPHKEAFNRLFVLVPVAEIAGKLKHPIHQTTFSEQLKLLKENPEYNKILKGRASFPQK